MQSGTTTVEGPEDLQYREHIAAAKRLSKLRSELANSTGYSFHCTLPNHNFALPSTTLQPQNFLPYRHDPVEWSFVAPANVHVDSSGLQSWRPASSVETRPRVESTFAPRRASDNVRYNQRPSPQRMSDPMIFPGLYSPSGFDMMSILVRVYQRPSPKIDLGFIDSACALALCSATMPDLPLVYVSDAFSALTGYTNAEIVGRNCRFLQSPTGLVHPGSHRVWDIGDDGETPGGILEGLKNGIAQGEETQTCLVNYKKNGEKFENLLTTIPIEWGDGRRFIVGFQAARMM